jgi:hypothetical protein
MINYGLIIKMLNFLYFSIIRIKISIRIIILKGHFIKFFFSHLKYRKFAFEKKKNAYI